MSTPLYVSVFDGTTAIYGSCNGLVKDVFVANGVYGDAWNEGTGVSGWSFAGDGVRGVSDDDQHAGVSAENTAGGYGVLARGNPAGYFESASGDAVRCVSSASAHAGVSASNEAGGIGLWVSGSPAGQFEGDVNVDGDVSVGGTLTVQVDIVLASSDCAEEFVVVGDAPPGAVLAFDDEGSLALSTKPYDTRVAGVVSGAGDLRPGLVLGCDGRVGPRARLALIGSVYCFADATQHPIRPGDLLTTSTIPGHAMRVTDRGRALGALLGKALGPLPNGRGVIPILVALQ